MIPLHLLTLIGGSLQARYAFATNVEDYRLLQPLDIMEKLNLWKNEYPNLVRINSAQEAFNLPQAGTKDDCLHDVETIGCTNYFFTIQDFVAHPEGSESSAQLPEVFWNGALHGDERIGPTVVMESAALLLEAATCEANPNHKSASWGQTISDAPICRLKLKELGVDDEHRRWLSRLVSTRRIVVVPTANALGFDRSQQGEELIDPREDFAYDQNLTDTCMQTIAVRTVNEIFREHIFQIAISFQSGTGGIGYSWGSPSWLEQTSPDRRGQNDVAQVFTALGGVSGHSYGQINDQFGARRGRFEDWAYAASWDSNHVLPCNPETLGGYTEEKTRYNNSTNRAVAMLVSVDAENIQSHQDLGNSMNLFAKEQEGNFLIARNMRLAFVSVDLVQPYVSIFGIDNLVLSDLLPLAQRNESHCQQQEALAVPYDQAKMIVEWTVGGAIQVSHTELLYMKVPDVPEEQFDCLKEPENMKNFRNAHPLGAKHGSGYFSPSGPTPHPNESFIKPGGVLGPVFRAEIDMRDFNVGDHIVLVSRASVDQGWRQSSKHNHESSSIPQSHLVNARINPDWAHENAGKMVKGKVEWYSMSVTVVLADLDYSISSDEPNNHLDGDTYFAEDVVKGSAVKSFRKFLAVVICIGAALICATRIKMQRRAEIDKSLNIMQAELDAVRKESKWAFKDEVDEIIDVYGNVDYSNTEIVDFQSSSICIA